MALNLQGSKPDRAHPITCLNPATLRSREAVPAQLLGVFTFFAAFESGPKSERVRVAKQEVKAGWRQTWAGRPVARPRRLTPEKVAKIPELRLTGLKWHEIARRVGLPAGTCSAG